MSTTQYKAVSVSLPKDILGKVDVIAEESYRSRSDVIREALISRIVPIYTPTKEEKGALACADKDIEKGNVTSWDTFMHELES